MPISVLYLHISAEPDALSSENTSSGCSPNLSSLAMLPGQGNSFEWSDLGCLPFLLCRDSAKGRLVLIRLHALDFHVCLWMQKTLGDLKRVQKGLATASRPTSLLHTRFLSRRTNVCLCVFSCILSWSFWCLTGSGVLVGETEGTDSSRKICIASTVGKGGTLSWSCSSSCTALPALPCEQSPLTLLADVLCCLLAASVVAVDVAVAVVAVVDDAVAVAAAVVVVVACCDRNTTITTIISAEWAV
eukprot:3470219-Amphidinium_carterae.1